jgi:hypothetical protein
MTVATPERVAALRAQLAPLFDGVSEVNQRTLADGTIAAEVAGRIRHVHLVRSNLDGRTQLGCVRSLDAAVAFILGLETSTSAKHGHERPVATH